MDAIELEALLLASPADHQRRSELARRAVANVQRAQSVGA